ncbi:hypothetical protein HMPREF1531_02360 [Propionibacterium sp. oral taxon 192 str. F0372]|nr:hypothetical protein HMPREF1531_02360 [Propionibacterium sp. oral taxon 192 str. F0372]
MHVLGHVAGDARLRGRVGYVTQQPSVYVDLSLRANLEYYCRLMRADPRSVGEIAERVGLGDLLERRVSAMSGGQAGRASLACALVGDPELLVLDEPTVGLDPLTREQLWSAFRRLADSGSTLMVSSHVMDEALRCDRLVLMRQGRILMVTTPEDLLANTGEHNPDRAHLTLVRADEEASR